MPAFFEYTAVYILGGLVYGFIEIAFRGFTHWSMLLTGGLCFTMVYIISAKSREPIWKKWIMGGAVITTIEFVAGGILNILLGWNVWSYSDRMFNLMGQICPRFSLAWVALCIPAMWLCQNMKKYFQTFFDPAKKEDK